MPLQLQFLVSFLALLVSCSRAPGTSQDAGPDAADDTALHDTANGSDAGTDAAAARFPLVDHQEWTPVAPADDPFDDRPTDAVCEKGEGWDVELFDVESTLGVDTNFCDYLTVAQPLLVDVPEGGTVELRLWHFALVGEGEAHIAVRVGDVMLWETRVPIPGDSQLIFDSIEAPQALGAGTPVYFHLHNHGNNTYNLVDLVLVP